MRKFITVIMLVAALFVCGDTANAKTTKKISKSSTTKTVPLEFRNGVAVVAGHTYAATVPGGKISWYFNPNGRLKMTFKNQGGEGYWEQRDDTFQFYGVDYNFMGYGQVSDDGKTIYIIPSDGTEEFEIKLVK